MHTIYVVSLPAGPVWVLHGVYLLVTGLMLAWKLQWRHRDGMGAASRGPSPRVYDVLPLPEHAALTQTARRLQ